MCITHVAVGGTETFVLRGFGLEAWEISPRDLRNLDKFIAAGKLPEGRPVGDLLMHYDEESRQLAPAADAAFIYLTREGSLGVIEITDRVVKTENAGGFGQSASRSRVLPGRSLQPQDDRSVSVSVKGLTIRSPGWRAGPARLDVDFQSQRLPASHPRPGLPVDRFPAFRHHGVENG